MRDNNHEGPRKRHSFAIGVIAMFITALLLTTAAFADVKLTDNLGSWDDGTSRWENGLLNLRLNSDPQPFSNGLGFDDDEVVDACGAGTKTKWAGTVQLGHDTLQTKNNAQGFQSTKNWYAVDCTTFSQLHDTQKYVTDSEKLLKCETGNDPDIIEGCEIVSQDVVVDCTPVNNCTKEIVTTVRGNLDADCNGSIDDPAIEALVNANSLCFYWEAVKPPMPGPGDPKWTGNIQSRINDGGGDKTVNFHLLSPSAITLSRMDASSAADLQVSIIIGLLAMIVVASVAAGLLQRWQRRVR